MISIHTPTKGATLFVYTLFQHLHYFNPHSHEGSDIVFSSCPNSTSYFNPHSHEGSDATGADIGICKRYFNPHSHEGSDDVKEFLDQLDGTISIHTPTKGATAILTNNFLIFCSISLINFILYLQIIQILFIVRYKFIFYFIF